MIIEKRYGEETEDFKEGGKCWAVDIRVECSSI
jgi:hypothetical protein